MTIFFVARKYDYATWPIPDRGSPSFEFETWYPAFQKIAGGNHKISAFWLDEEAYRLGRHGMNQELLRRMRAEKPQAAFFYVNGDEIRPETIREITEKIGVVTVYWCADDSWRFDSVSRRYAPYYAWTITLDSGAAEKYRRSGCRVIHSQSAANTEIFRPVGKDKDIAVSFVGTRNKPRANIIKALEEADMTASVFGRGWLAGKISREKMIEVFSRSRISLNLNTPSFYWGLRPLARLFLKRAEFIFEPMQIRPDFRHLFRNLREWRQKKIPQIKARTFEICACRTLGITQMADNLGDYYKIGKEIVVYKDIPDLIEKIRYYLKHDEEREKIAQAGYERTLRDHTVAQRLEQIFKTIGLPLGG